MGDEPPPPCTGEKRQGWRGASWTRLFKKHPSALLVTIDGLVRRDLTFSDVFYAIHRATCFHAMNYNSREQDEDYPASHHHRASEVQHGQRLLHHEHHTDDTHLRSVQSSL